jgi:FlaA1/EpsC-like NDP-sugar epimerase
MEDVLFETDGATAVSTARFANVAFSDGSLLHGFRQRLMSAQPISAPHDVRRYFVTGTESGRLCLASVVLGRHREIFFPHLEADLKLLTFSEIAVRFLESNGYEAVEVSSEDEARRRARELIAQRKWPCYFFASDTSGEKPFEEFYSEDDAVDWSRFKDIGVIETRPLRDEDKQRLHAFLAQIEALRAASRWTKGDLVAAITAASPDLEHIETGRSLDNKM